MVLTSWGLQGRNLLLSGDFSPLVNDFKWLVCLGRILKDSVGFEFTA